MVVIKKSIFTLFFLTIALVSSGTTYYISPSGSNSNNGSSSSPWKTLAYACTKATTSGDIIHLNAGTYYESSQSLLSVGVNIEGAGMANTIIESSYTGSSQPLLKAETSNGWLGTYGNQSISGIKFDGNMTTYSAVTVNFRSNFIIHDCTFVDFVSHGVLFSGQPEWDFTVSSPYDVGTFPSYWCSGNQFYNNVVTNCATMSGYSGDGNLRYGTQLGFLVHDNVITQTARSEGTNGYGIKFCERGFNRGTKCYNNTITIAPNTSGTFNFSIEIWNDLDQCEYYNNTLQGCVDVTQAYKRRTSYGIWIHDNIMGFASQQDHDEMGIDLEAYVVGAIINNNKITNCSLGILNAGTWPNQDHPQNSTFDDVHIYNNLITGVGSTGGGGGIFGITWGSAEIDDHTSNYYIYNNTIVSSGNYVGNAHATVGIDLSDFGITANNVQIKNNIIKGFTGGNAYYGPITANGTSSYTNLKITNNDFYGNGNSNAVKWTGSFSPGTGYDYSSNLTSDPLLGSDFKLQTGSPAIGAGINVGLSSDFKGNPWNAYPCIGAYEFNPPIQAPDLPVYQNSSIENATPSRLDMTYNLVLSRVVPSTSAFSVMVNSVARTVSSVIILETKVQLTLASPVVSSDVVTVSYTKPTTNPLQVSTGGLASTITAQKVTNNVSAIIPVIISSSVESATPTILSITYNNSLANFVPAISSFSVLVNSVARVVNSVAVSGTSVKLNLSTPIIAGDVVTVSYTKPTTNPLQGTTGGQASTITAQKVTNNVSAIIPIFISSSVESIAPTVIAITYNNTLTNIVPATSSFTVLVNSVARVVSSVAVSGTSVKLTLSTPIVAGDIITLSYTKPALNPIQTTTGGQAISISAQIVTNRVGSSGVPVYLGSTVEDATPALIKIDYDMALINVAPAVSAFSVIVNSLAMNVKSVTVSGTSVILNLAYELLYGDVVTITYTKPTTSPLQTSTGLLVATMSSQIVKNKVNPNGPVYLNSSIENDAPDILKINFDEIVETSVPATSSFIVMVNGVKASITSVAISGNTVLLTLTVPVVSGDNVTVSYIKPSSNELKKATGETAVSFSSPQPVTNNCTNLAGNSLKKGSITIYPNPAREFINISVLETSLQPQLLKIYDLSGKLFLESQITTGTSNKVLINLKSGIYVVQVVSGTIINFVQKLIVL